MTDDLIPRLRALARAEHDDLSVADEAADMIQQQQELLRSAGQELNRLRDCLILLPGLRLQEQFGNPYPACTKLPESPE